MLRTPEPKEQARLLTKLLEKSGLQLGYQASLNIVAQLHGHRNWNVMEASLGQQPGGAEAGPSNAIGTPPQGWQVLVNAAQHVVDGCDDTGCADDLTVTSATAVDRLSELLERQRREGCFASTARNHSFIAADVLTLRPDLSDDEAEEVVQVADERFDASVGMSWDVLQVHADQLFDARVVEGQLVEASSQKELTPVVIDYSDGTIYCGSLDELRDPAIRHQRQVSLHYSGDFLVYLGDGSYVQLEDDDGGQLFGGITERLHNSIGELREYERATGQLLVRTFA